MTQAGIDISGHASKAIEDLPDIEFDWVVTVCSNAEENYPLFPGRTKRRHFGFHDPPKLAEDAASDEEALSHYRRVRDEIRGFVEQLPGILDA